MIRWTVLAPWEFEFPFPGSLTSTFLETQLKGLPAPCLRRFGLTAKYANRIRTNIKSRESNGLPGLVVQISKLSLRLFLVDTNQFEVGIVADVGFRNVQRFRGGLVFKVQRRVYHSTLGLRVIKKKRKKKVHPFRAVGECSVSRWRLFFGGGRRQSYRGTSLIRKRPPP